MTKEGIVQKVLSEYINMSKEDSNNTHLSLSEQSHYRMINKLLIRIEQELIEAIKQELKDYDMDIIRIIIGDTK